MCRSTDAPEWMSARRVVCLGVGLIVDGALDEGVEGDLASELGVSGRHLRRLFNNHLGVTPSRLARASRLRRAARFLVATDIAIAEIAHRAGFGSIRQLNRVCREVFGTTPIELRRGGVDRFAQTEILTLRLPTTIGSEWTSTLDRLGSTAVPQVEFVDRSAYRRVVVVDGVPGAFEMAAPANGHLTMRIDLQDWRELLHVVHRAISLLYPEGVARESWNNSLTDDRGGDLAATSPPRVPDVLGVWDPFELAVKEALSAQFSSSGVEAITSQLAEVLGTPTRSPIHPRLTRSFPSPETLAASNLGSFGLEPSTQHALRRLAIEVRDGRSPFSSAADIGEGGRVPANSPTAPWIKSGPRSSSYIDFDPDALDVDGLDRQTKSA